MKNSNMPHDAVNPASQAKEIAKEPMTNVDHLVQDENGNQLIGPEATLREGVRAGELGAAAGHATYSDELKENVTPSAATHDGCEARLEAAEPRRGVDEEKLEAVGKRWAAIAQVPHNFLDPRHRVTANAAMVCFVVGDTAVLASQLYRSGSAIGLAVLVGLSLAGTVVMTGKQCGHEVSASKQRLLRGVLPMDSHLAVRTFFESGEAEARDSEWLYLAYAAAAFMFLALFFLGIGSGDPPKLALGYGLLGSLTVAGSACAEAYATNDAAEHLKAAESEMRKISEDLKEYENLESQSADAGTTARLHDAAARHTAAATDITVATIANRLTDTPEIAGYIAGGQRRQIEAAPRPVEVSISASDAPLASVRSRTRPKLSIELHDPTPTDARLDPGDADTDTTSETPSEETPLSSLQDHVDRSRVNGSVDRVVS